MEPLQIAERLKQEFGESVLSTGEYMGQASASIRKDDVLSICLYLRDTSDMAFSYLRDLTAVDYLGKRDIRFEMVYHLYSLSNRHMIRLKAPVEESDCSIDSVCPVWSGADWHERECFDLFGITFRGHPDMRRILMPEDWEGHPLRKDYPVEGPGSEHEWPGYREVLEKAERFKEFQWDR